MRVKFEGAKMSAGGEAAHREALLCETGYSHRRSEEHEGETLAIAACFSHASKVVADMQTKHAFVSAMIRQT